MSWIERAKRSGKGAAEQRRQEEEQKAADKAKFEAEPVSPEQLGQYLRPFLPPVAKILSDLKRDGFKIEPQELDYLIYSELSRTGPDEARRRTYSMARVTISTEGSREDRYNAAMGLVWTITHPLYPHESCCIWVFPKANTWTHYAGVEYKVNSSVVQVEAPQGAEILEFLQNTVGGWIQKMEELKNLRSK